MIDLTLPPVTRASAYSPYVDATLPHQLTLRWDPDSKCTYVIATCNCGEHVGYFRPETAGALAAAEKAYDEHIRMLL